MGVPSRTALESISAQHQTELDQAKDATSDETAVQLVTAQNNILSLEQQLRDREKVTALTHWPQIWRKVFINNFQDNFSNW